MPLRVAVGILSGAALANELLLMRLFSIVQWHHLAYLVISLALLGYGASGAALTVFRRPLRARFDTAFVVFAALFGLLAVGCFSLAQRFRLNPLELVWEPRQLATLSGVYLLLALPFFCAGSAIGLALARFEKAVHRVYRADLLGAAVGALSGFGCLYLVAPDDVLRLVGVAGGIAAGVVWTTIDRTSADRRSRAVLGLLTAATIVAPIVWPSSWLEPQMSEFKSLAKARSVPGTEVVAESTSPLGSLTALASPQVPFRLAPGLSFHYSGSIPEQILVFRDGEVAAVLDRGTPPTAARDSESYLTHLPLALAFELVLGSTPQPRVAVLGAGAGTGLVLALTYGAAEVHVVELDRRLVDLWTGDLADFAGRPYDDRRVRKHLVDPRGFLSAPPEALHPEGLDLIVLPAIGAAGGSGGADSLRASYTHTVEALAQSLERTTENGVIALEGEIAAPPQTSLKLAATAAEALERLGLAPVRHLAAIRTWSRFVIVVKRSVFDRRDIEVLRSFCAERGFDLVYYPGMREAEANRFHRLDEPELFRGIEALLGPERSRFVRDYKFDIRPATDDRPYLLHSFRWGTLGELLGLRRSGGAALLEWSYLFLVATLVQATLAGLVLILLPVWFLRRTASPERATRVGVYFLCLGLAFLFLEIAFIQRLTLFLGHPLLAAGVVLAGFLLFAGIGSGASRWIGEIVPRHPIRVVTAAIAAVAIAELAALPALSAIGGAWPTALRLPAALLVIAPLAFLLGMPFPLGLQRVAAHDRELVPWAWGVNGWASVLAAVLATLLSVHFGFTIVVLAACALYLVAAAAAPRDKANW